MRRRSGADRRWRELCAAARRLVRTSPDPVARAGPPSNDSNPRSRRLYQAVAKILVLVRRLGLCRVFDGLASGNHRRGYAGATPGRGTYGTYRCAINGGGGHTSRPFASGRFSPRAPAPAAPQPPAQPATRRDNPDETAPSCRCRRSTPPANPVPRQPACDSENKGRADN
jgi:hypothetical protein